jgi:nitrogen fixation NifU-like protein
MLYSKKVMEHFRNPHNYGRMNNPDGIGKVGNIICGDVLWLYIKVKDGKLAELKFETFGCAAALATSSVITDIAKGKTIEEALKMTNQDVIKELGELPPVKIHCSLLAVDALYEAIYDYLSRAKKPIPPELEKKHRKIRKDRENVEKRYGDFMESRHQQT